MRSRGAPVPYSTESPDTRLLCYSLESSVPLFCRFPHFRRNHVSAFNFCMSLFR